MSSQHSVLITGAPCGPGAGPAGGDRRPTRAAFEREIQAAGQGQSNLEDDIRGRERARIVHDLHDTLFQGFLGASLLLDQAVEQTPADCPSMPALTQALRLVRRAIEDGRAAMRGICTDAPRPSSLEEALSNLLKEVAYGRHVRVRISVLGTPRVVNPAIQEQLFLISREAVMNALRHSGAARIEVEVHYLRDVLRLRVRDNGRGIDAGSVQRERHSHWGLDGMRKRAANIGARFVIWSRPGVGTEVRVAVPVDVAKQQQPMRAILGKGGARYDERQLHPSVERRRPPVVPGGRWHHHQLPDRHVAGGDRLERPGSD